MQSRADTLKNKKKKNNTQSSNGRVEMKYGIYRIFCVWLLNTDPLCCIAYRSDVFFEMARLWRAAIVYQSRGPESVPINLSKRTRVQRNKTSAADGEDAATVSFWSSALCLCFIPLWPAQPSADRKNTHPVPRTNPVFMILFWLVSVRINGAASDATSARLSGGYRPVRSICFAGHFRQCPFLSHYFDRNWISSDAFLCILSATVFSLGVYHFQRGDGTKTLQLEAQKELEMDLGF